MPYDGVRGAFPASNTDPLKRSLDVFKSVRKKNRAEAAELRRSLPKSSRSSGRRSTGGGGGYLKAPKTLPYPKLTRKNPLRAPTALETGVGALGLRKLAGPLSRAARAAATRAGPTVIPQGGAFAGREAVGLIPAAGYAAIAGALAYGLTKAGLSLYAAKKATMRENAARAADAYRFARQKLAEDQRRPLNKSQQKRLSIAFKNRMLELGLSTSDLGRIMGRSAYDTSPPPASRSREDYDE